MSSSSESALVRPTQGYYLRPRATFEREGPLVSARTATRVTALESAALTRGATGKVLLLARVEVAEGPRAGEAGFAALSLADFESASTDPREVARVARFRANFTLIASHLSAHPAAVAAPPVAAEEDGLVVDGKIVALPGVEVLSYLRHPALVPLVHDGRRRVEPVQSLVVHTVHGKHGDLVEAASAPSTRAERYARYQATTPRSVSWHLTLDTDGTLLVSADLARWSCWHAPPTNGWSVGLELVQETSGRLYGPQLDVAVKVIATVCDLLHIPKRVPVDAHGDPQHLAIRAWQPRVEGGRSERWAGVLAHRNVTTNRGVGDAGDAVMRRLLAAGFAPALVLPRP